MPSHVLRDQGPPSTLDSTSAPIPVTVTHFVPPKVTVTVQLDPAASTLSADPSFVSVDIDPSRATLVTDPKHGRRQKKRGHPSIVVKVAEMKETFEVKHNAGLGSAESFIGGSPSSMTFLDERPPRSKPASKIMPTISSPLKSPPPAYAADSGFAPSTSTSLTFSHHRSSSSPQSILSPSSPVFAPLPVFAHSRSSVINSLQFGSLVPLTTAVAYSYTPDPLAASIQIFPHERERVSPTPIPTSRNSLHHSRFSDHSSWYSYRQGQSHQRDSGATYRSSREESNEQDEEGNVYTATIVSTHHAAAIQVYPGEREREPPSTPISPTSRVSSPHSHYSDEASLYSESEEDANLQGDGPLTAAASNNISPDVLAAAIQALSSQREREPRSPRDSFYSDDASLYSYYEDYLHSTNSGTSYRWSQAQGGEPNGQEEGFEPHSLDVVTQHSRPFSIGTNITTFRSPLLREGPDWRPPSLPPNRCSALDPREGEEDELVSRSPSPSGSLPVGTRNNAGSPIELKRPRKLPTPLSIVSAFGLKPGEE
ncbi:uncharacterized protein LACBIDRAFT_331650 [Laccaria bicolor S238N-H82]|uniref:Predicted protein n=1 Tax=Laccaria bicolor (strain S238N-H82 / ATCC MYA-4686) TaxID=486041 RepID=B0DQ48_LACBS|nr:uncharacterized protein LACBIDRAFT_331650 [Laccaria bicolor S238N-H82]EDR03324.1 predicted protein [Laccaria bicolor S238N-H82]|eukprot:XP_001886120.1 predicted protein [Laccaria bicolor S238N-H82]